MRDRLDRSMRPVGGGEGVVDIEIAKLGELLGEAGVVLLLAGVVAQVLEHGHLAGLQCIDAAPCLLADAILDEMHLRAAASARAILAATGRKRGVGPRLALGPAEMRQHDHLRAAIRELLDGRQARGSIRVVSVDYRHPAWAR